MRCVWLLPLLLSVSVRAQNITGDQTGTDQEGAPDQAADATSTGNHQDNMSMKSIPPRKNHTFIYCTTEV